ncbi:MAG: hypothetical protein CMJ49_13230 [Planctomycetaceae bacterium]|nr:hypothetical protein [Planctomycetaceae bacterium]
MAPATTTRSEPILAIGPIVLVEDQPEPQLWVTRWQQVGRLDRRRATIAVARTAASIELSQRAAADHWRGRAVTILQPLLLAGGDAGTVPVVNGRLAAVEIAADAGSDELSFDVIDEFDALLDQPVNSETFDTPPADATADEILAIRAGQWSLSQSIRRINELTALNLSASLLAPAAARRTVSQRMFNGASIRLVLERVLTAHDLYLQRALRWDGRGVRESRHVRAAHDMRPVQLGLGDLADANSTINAVQSMLRAGRPAKLIAEADGQVVESTFTLVGGWDPALESLPDSEYARSTSTDFDAVAPVFRLWTLNEDGAWSDPPFSRGPAFDLTALFDDGRAVDAQPLVFRDALTQTDPGVSVGIVVDISTDSGSSWTRYPGQVVVLDDRAAVYLDDDALPAGFITAGKADAARVRVTASLRSPLPLTGTRWRGNPFAGSFQTHRFRLGRQFQHQRLSSNSKYFNDVRSAQREADEADDRPAMAQWLMDQAERLPREAGELKLRTADLQIALRPGDRLTEVAGRQIAGDLNDPAAPGPAVHLCDIEHDLNRHTSQLAWRVSG